jgi:hypothetical protein
VRADLFLAGRKTQGQSAALDHIVNSRPKPGITVLVPMMPI